MNIFDIIGPIMVGPSSSHTAGAVRIGYISRQLLGEDIEQAHILLHGSFLATGKGHGTDRALVAGLLGMKEDDERIANSLTLAKEIGLKVNFDSVDLQDYHPNSVLLKLHGISGRNIKIIASSIGGGRIKICNIDGLEVSFSGDYPTLIVHNIDQPGLVTEVTALLAHKSVNIATIQLYRDIRGGNAVMVIECDQEVSKESVKLLNNIAGILKVTYFNLEE